MRVSDALEQLDVIHEHLTRAEVYRGFRVPSVVLVGVVGLGAAAAQQVCVAPGDSHAYVLYWMVIAAAGAVLGVGAAVHSYVVREDDFSRRRTRRVFGQFLPCLVAGAAVTAAFDRAGSPLVALLPGAWAVIFGLGVVSARPYLPRGVGLVGLGYVAVGSVLLARPEGPSGSLGWEVGGVFGFGHLATAFVLWRDQPRGPDE